MRKHKPKNTPIIIPCFQRPEFLKITLDHLKECKGIEKFTVHFCVDMRMMQGKKPYTKTKECIDLCESWSASSKKVHRRLVQLESENATGAIGYVMESEGYRGGFIYLEEDVVVAKCFLQYCLDALNTYEDNPWVLLVSGYQRGDPQTYTDPGKWERLKFWFRNYKNYLLERDYEYPQGVSYIDKAIISPNLLGVCSWWSRWEWIHKGLNGWLRKPSSLNRELRTQLHIPQKYPFLPNILHGNGRPLNTHGMGFVMVYGLLHGRYTLCPSLSLTNHIGWYGWHARHHPDKDPHHAACFNPENKYSRWFPIVDKKMVARGLKISEEEVKDPKDL